MTANTTDNGRDDFNKGTITATVSGKAQDGSSNGTKRARRPCNMRIRAIYDQTTITVYQAYPASIATAAVASRSLTASPHFKLGRMTWIKPSWCWMLYRSFYSFKEPRQAHILAIQMTREGFDTLLRNASLTSETSSADASRAARVQWDPERDARLGKVDGVRTIQIGIPKELVQMWATEWIVVISDVTERARLLKETLDAEPDVTDATLVKRGLLPVEQEYHLPEDIVRILEHK